MGNDHPRFWGWYMGAGNPVGNLADLLASVLNPNLGGADHSPVLVEQQVVRWCAEAAGYPTDASGLLVTGASEANLVGLAVARAARIGPTLRTDGMPDGRRFGVYASTEVHSCHRKTVELLGLGSYALRLVPVTDDCTIDLDALAATIAADRAAGIEPLAVVATAGTINTGAVDDLDAIADLAEREGLWFHVDGAIGGFLALSGQRGCRARARARRLPRARPPQVDAGADRRRPRPGARRAGAPGDLLGRPGVPRARHARPGRRRGVVQRVRHRPLPRLPGPAGVDGAQGLRRRRVRPDHRRHVAQAHALADRVDAHPDLERLAPVGCDVVCLRYAPAGVPPTGSTRSTTSSSCASRRAGWRSSPTPSSTAGSPSGSRSATTAPATRTSTSSSTPSSSSGRRPSPTSRPAPTSPRPRARQPGRPHHQPCARPPEEEQRQAPMSVTTTTSTGHAAGVTMTSSALEIGHEVAAMPPAARGDGIRCRRPVVVGWGWARFRPGRNRPAPRAAQPLSRGATAPVAVGCRVSVAP